jgi:hypothetical protein
VYVLFGFEIDEKGEGGAAGGGAAERVAAEGRKLKAAGAHGLKIRYGNLYV